MRIKLLPALSLIIVVCTILSSCSSVKISNVEKRRYQRGYYVQMNNKAPKNTSARHRPEAVSKRITAQPDKPASKRGVAYEMETEDIRTSFKKFAADLDVKQFMATVDEVVYNASVMDTRKNLSSVPTVRDHAKGGAAVYPNWPGVMGTGVSTVVLLVLFLVVFLILLEPIIAILMAVLLALLIIWLLRALDVID